MSSLREQLVRIVAEQGLQRLPEPVELASGELSSEFVDGKQALADGADLELACRAMLEELSAHGIDFDAVGGLTMGADAFSHVLAVLARCRWFTVRKTPKGRGTNRLVEGARVGEGDRVVLIDDVVTTGGSIQQALAAVRETGADVVAALTLVDRGEVAKAFFAAEGIPYVALVTYVDLGIPPVGRGLVDASTPGA
jgi:orotate phosphoribosyltransferase